MNYIKNLQAQLQIEQTRRVELEQGIKAFCAMLQTAPKFNGVESNGERKDWIATTDVIRWGQEIISENRC